MSVTINASTSSGLVQTADTSGTVEIQSNGSTKLTVASTGAYGQLVSGTAQTASSTAVDFTGIPSWVKRITVMLSGVSVSGTSALIIQLGDSGGIENTGYTGIRLVSDGTGTAVAAVTAGLSVATWSQAADTAQGIIIFTNVTGNTWTGSSVISRNSGLTAAVITTSTTKTLSDTLTQIRITTANGTDTFDAGTINILYEG